MSGRWPVAKRLQSLAVHLSQLPGTTSPADTEGDIPLERIVSDRELLALVAPLYVGRHYPQAVEEACKFLDDLVRDKSGRRDLTGTSLMQHVFSPNNPVLALNSCTTESEMNEQRGYMQILAGVMIGVRNPRAHGSGWTDSKEHALQLLSLANHLVGKVKTATKV